MILFKFRHKNSLRKFVRTIKRISQTYYPGFIFNTRSYPNSVPVFVYHDIQPEDFEADLRFLKINGYITISIDDFLKKNFNSSHKYVLLTFDDARRNFYDTVFPLLKKYNFRATIFLPTFWIKRNCDLDIKSSDIHANLFMKWEEVRDCKNSFLIDVQSHGYRHALVYNTKCLETFVTPDFLKNYDVFDWPMRRHDNVDSLGYPKLGTPIYSAKPLLSSSHRIVEDERISKICQSVVSENGGSSFFYKKNWADLLEKVFYVEYKHGAGFFKSGKDDFISLIKTEFTLSGNDFEDNLNVRPKYFAFPWELGTDFSIQSAAETGLKALFGVGKDFSRVQNKKHPVPCFSRIKGDWLRFLPGEGRKRFRDVFIKKIKGFHNIQHPVH